MKIINFVYFLCNIHYISSNYNYNRIIITKKNINNKQINNKQINYPCINMLSNEYKLLDKLLDINIYNNKNLGRIVVEKTSALLPHVDSIGHKVLHANNEFIYYILNFSNLSHDLKKDIVLFSIKAAQYGDNAGSYLLQIYYDLVDKCL